MSGNWEIAKAAKLRPIAEIAAAAGLGEDEWEPYGRYKAKVRLEALEHRRERPNGKLVLMTAITPTPAGEGKTTMAVGLAQGLCRLGSRCIAALREPSQGPVFGIKGGGSGGGYSQLMPMDDINLHCTGDIHAMTAANNLLAAVIDNHLQWDNPYDLDVRAITWKRCLDVNDRALRSMVSGLGGSAQGTPRETGFEITAASEVMAILSLASSREDLRMRLGRIVVGRSRSGEPVTAEMLGAGGAMAVLLKDALLPNLVQTIEGTPALVHGGPFGNIAHGCSSVLATRTALKLGDICVTEAGFGADLGAEKFLNIKMRQAGTVPDLGVVVATVRALKMHGGVQLPDLAVENLEALRAGMGNLLRHVENLGKFGLRVVVGINRFYTDTEPELALLRKLCGEAGLAVAEADVWGHGGAGAEELSRLVLDTLEKPGTAVHPLYPDDLPLADKIMRVALETYRAGEVKLLQPALRGIQWLESHGFGNLPVCFAKTQYSFSDDPIRRGAPTGHALTVRDVKLSAGAGFVVVYAGSIVTMPGLPRNPAIPSVELLPDGTIDGLF